MKAHYVPSQHRLMPLADRISLYRRVIGYLHFADYKPESLTFRMRLDLDTYLNMAVLITGSAVMDAHEQLHLMRVLLADALVSMPAKERQEIYSADTDSFRRRVAR